ncbi:MAG: hypothetical protein ABI831_05540, partial [Betaproteobacteria bacterium]
MRSTLMPRNPLEIQQSLKTRPPELTGIAGAAFRMRVPAMFHRFVAAQCPREALVHDAHPA